MEHNAKKFRRFVGDVVSDKMMKTVVVAVTTLKVHPKYKKQYKVTKRFKANSETNDYKVGDRVTIEETNPISKDKKWKVIGRI